MWAKHKDKFKAKGRKSDERAKQIGLIKGERELGNRSGQSWHAMRVGVSTSY